MQLIKIETIKNQNIISVVEVPDIQCEEPCSTGQVYVVKYQDGKPVTKLGSRFFDQNGVLKPAEQVEVYEPYHFLLYSVTMLDKLNKLNDIVLYTQYYWESDDHGEYDAGSNVKKENCLSLLLEHWEYYTDDLILPVEQIVANLKQNMHDSDYVGFCMEEEEYKEYQSEKERKELEKAAAEFASKCGHPVGTPAYVHAIHKAISGAWNDYDDDRNGERRMERWAAHQYCGSTSSFWEDEDYINGQHMNRIETLEMVLEWLNKNCPLLMLKINEQIREEKNDLVEA